MPRLRLLADRATGNASAISGAAGDGAPAYDVSPGDVVPVVLDATGYAGTDSISGSTWDVSGSAAISDEALVGDVASCTVTVPETGAWYGNAFRVRNTLTLGSGQKRSTTIWLRARA